MDRAQLTVAPSDAAVSDAAVSDATGSAAAVTFNAAVEMPFVDQALAAPAQVEPTDPGAAMAYLGPLGRFSRGDRLIAQQDFRAVLRRGRRVRGAHLQVSLLLRHRESFARTGGHASSPTQHDRAVGPDPVASSNGLQLQANRTSARVQPARPRLGLSVAKAAGNSPARARLRRLLREAFRCLRGQLAPHAALVIAVRTPWPNAQLADVVAELQPLLRGLGDVQRGDRGPRGGR